MAPAVDKMDHEDMSAPFGGRAGVMTPVSSRLFDWQAVSVCCI
jgi:hypothetical protein